VTGRQHAGRIVLLMGCAAGLLGYMAGHSAVMFNDGLRYIDQARRLDQGALQDGLLKAVDHPAYPVEIVLAHRFLLGDSSPDAWQHAAQAASLIAGVLWVAPLYLVAVELFGAASAWLAVVLCFLVPTTGHVLADVMSEGAFLLFWTWGLYTALRFLRQGDFFWLPMTIGLSALAYLARPEGALLAMAIVATVGAVPLLRSTRMLWRRWWAAVAFLILGPSLLVAPYVAMKGGLGTKPAIARLLGTAPKSAATAVERQRPLDPNQSTAETYGIAARQMAQSVREAVTLPLIPFALAGLILAWPPGGRARAWVMVTFILVASALALIRLHATGGYCTPRHAMVIAYLLIPAAAFGMHTLVGKITVPGRWLGLDDARYAAGPAVWAILLGGLGYYFADATLAPINEAMAGYRDAGTWVAQRVEAHGKFGEKVKFVDVTGLSLYYGGADGYTFANLIDAPDDPTVKYIVVRDAHLNGPWPYCKTLKSMTEGLRLLATYPEDRKPNQAKVFIFMTKNDVAKADTPVRR